MDVEEYVGAPPAAGTGDLTSATVPLSCLMTGDTPRRCGEDGSHARMLAGLGDRLPPIIVHGPPCG